MAYCVFCNGSTARLRTRDDGTHCLFCPVCGEEFVPFLMMHDNIAILERGEQDAEVSAADSKSTVVGYWRGQD